MSTSTIRRWSLTILVALGALGACAFLLSELRESRARTEAADSRALAATALALADTSPETAALLAVESLRLVEDASPATTFEARSALITTLDHVARAPVAVRARPGSIRSVAFSPNGRLLAYGDRTGTVRLLFHRTGTKLVGLRGHRGSVDTIAWSPDGTTLATGGSDRTIRLWDVETLKPIGILRGHTGDVDHLQFSPDGTRLVSAGGGYFSRHPDPTVRVWDVDLQRQLGRTLEVSAAGARFAADGRQLDVINIVGWLTRHPVPPVPFTDGYYDTSYTEYDQAESTPTGRLLVLNGEGGLEVRRVSGTRSTPIALPGDDDWKFSSVDVAAVAAGTRHIAASTVDGTITFWDATDLLDRFGPTTLPWSVAPRDGGAAVLAFEPRDQLVAAVGRDGALRLVSAARHSPLVGTGGDALFAQSYRRKVSADGRRVVRASFLADGTETPFEIVVRDRATGPVGKPIRTVGDAVALSPAGRDLAHFDAAGALQIRSIVDGKPLGPPLPLPVLANDVYSLAFSPDGRTLAATTMASQFQLWDVERRAPLGSLISGSGDDSDGLDPIVTATGLETWSRRVCGIVARNLTREEWRRFVPGHDYRQTCPGRGPA